MFPSSSKFRGRSLRWVALVLGSALFLGCFNPTALPTGHAYADLQSPDLMVRLDACKMARVTKDFGAVPHLMKLLSSEDINDRLLSHMALIQIWYQGKKFYDKEGKRLTPPRPFGYDSLTVDVAHRNRSIAFWEQWYKEELQRREEAATAKAGGSAPADS